MNLRRQIHEFAYSPICDYSSANTYCWSELLQVKVPMVFLVTAGFSPYRDGHYWMDDSFKVRTITPNNIAGIRRSLTKKNVSNVVGLT